MQWVTCTAYPFAVGGDGTKPSADARDGKAAASREGERRISCPAEARAEEPGTQAKVHQLKIKENMLCFLEQGYKHCLGGHPLSVLVVFGNSIPV